MKRVITLLCAGILVVNVAGQNIGIGNTNPVYKLDISGRTRIRGGINDNFTAGIWLGGINADSATNKIFLGMESDSSAGLYSDINATGWFLVANGSTGTVGIRNRDPKYPLSFNNQSGDKISLYQDGNGNYYGMGIGNATLQLTVPHISSSMVFGYGRSASFTENMRLTGTGNLGIGTTSTGLAGLTVDKKAGAVHGLFGSNTTGVAIESNFPGIGLNSYFNSSRKTIATGYSGYIGVHPTVGGMQFLVSTQSNNTDVAGTYTTAIDIKPDGKVGIGVSDPAYQLDVLGRLRIRSQPASTAGLWLNNNANSASPAFIGMFSDNEVGFYGTGTGWSLLMNTQTGALRLGGNAGNAGQVLTSNGTAGAPIWKDMSVTYGEAFQTNVAINSITDDEGDIGGLTANFTLTSPSKVIFNIRLMVSISPCFGCDDNLTYIVLKKNIVGGTESVIYLPVSTPVNSITTFVSGPLVLNLPAGTYSYKVMINNFGPGGTVTIPLTTISGLSAQNMISWQIIPN